MINANNQSLQPLILVENERTEGGNYDHWQDATGERYHFPNGYKNKVLPGRRFVYYRGTRKADGSRRIPEYFGHGVVGEVNEDPSNNPDEGKARRKWIATISEYIPFIQPLEFKKEGDPYEKIAQNRWAVAVREISEQTYSEILKDAGIKSNTSTDTNALQIIHPSNVKPQVAKASLLVPKQAKDRDINKQAKPNTNYRLSSFSTAIGNRGEEIILNRLKDILPGAEAKTLKWNSKDGETPGWDMQYAQVNGTIVAIEVKSTTGQRFPSIELTANEWSAAERLGKNYWLALVAMVMTDKPMIEFISDPYKRTSQGAFQIKPSIWLLEMNQSCPNNETQSHRGMGDDA